MKVLGIKWWCTSCQGWRWVRFGSQVGVLCTECNSGRCRPPQASELEEARL